MTKLEMLKGYLESKTRLEKMKRAVMSSIVLTIGDGNVEDALDILATRITNARIKGERVEEWWVSDYKSIQNLHSLYQRAVQQLEDLLRQIRQECNMPPSVLDEAETIRRLRQMIVDEMET